MKINATSESKTSSKSSNIRDATGFLLFRNFAYSGKINSTDFPVVVEKTIQKAGIIPVAKSAFSLPSRKRFPSTDIIRAETIILRDLHINIGFIVLSLSLANNHEHPYWPIFQSLTLEPRRQDHPMIRSLVSLPGQQIHLYTCH